MNGKGQQSVGGMGVAPARVGGNLEGCLEEAAPELKSGELSQ